MRNSFVETIKEIFRDWDLKVMSYVMVVVTATCMITATVAWFISSASTNVKGMEIETASGELIKLAVEQGGEDVDVLRKQGENPEATLEMPVFSGVLESEEGRKVLAPGTYGTVDLYVTSMDSHITKCMIYPSFFGSKGDEEGITYLDTVTEEEKAIINELVQGHILFFENYDAATGEFSGWLTEDAPLERDLQWENGAGIEEKVTIYWYWPYEYKDVPEEVKEALNRNQLLDPQQDALGEYTDSRLYDYADTRIGTFVENVKFHFEVSAVDEKANH